MGWMALILAAVLGVLEPILAAFAGLFGAVTGV